MGHAYSSISADVIARFKQLEGFEVKFLTGTDEHGSKIQKSAQKENLKPLDFCNNISKVFLDLTKKLNLSNTDFIRTTEKRHHESVKKLWEILEKNKEIYLSNYSGWYSISDEAFYSEEETILTENNKRISSSSGNEVEWVEEESYFFKLSKWQEPLLEFYKKNPDFIQPISRKNEITSFIKSGLKDLSISRTSFDWGIEVPTNKSHIIYVWLDALTNYISATNYFSDRAESEWPADLHIIGKDITRFHAVYWPAFLMAANIPLPKKIFAHGWILSGDEKMSKSKGNILDPLEIISEFGLDEVRYYLMKEIMYGSDGKINIENLKNCINSDMANNMGNLSQRIFSLVGKYYDNKIPKPIDLTKVDNELLNAEFHLFSKKMINFEIHNYLKEIVSFSSSVNKYVNDEEPWNRSKNSNDRISTIIYVTLDCLRKIFFLLYPVMPSKSELFLKSLGIKVEEILFSNFDKKNTPGTLVNPPGILFKKF